MLEAKLNSLLRLQEQRQNLIALSNKGFKLDLKKVEFLESRYDHERRSLTLALRFIDQTVANNPNIDYV